VNIKKQAGVNWLPSKKRLNGRFYNKEIGLLAGSIPQLQDHL
jgi:hypothetical protein